MFSENSNDHAKTGSGVIGAVVANTLVPCGCDTQLGHPFDILGDLDFGSFEQHWSTRVTVDEHYIRDKRKYP
jgi:hypothetical protein